MSIKKKEDKSRELLIDKQTTKMWENTRTLTLRRERWGKKQTMDGKEISKREATEGSSCARKERSRDSAQSRSGEWKENAENMINN